MEWITDDQWRIIWVDRKWEEGMGADFKTVEGGTGLHLIHPDDLTRAMHTSIQARAQLKSITLKIRLRQHGLWTPNIVVAEPVFENGKLTAYRGFNQALEQSAIVPAANAPIIRLPLRLFAPAIHAVLSICQ